MWKNDPPPHNLAISFLKLGITSHCGYMLHACLNCVELLYCFPFVISFYLKQWHDLHMNHSDSKEVKT